MNMFYYQLLIEKLLLSMTGQNMARWNIQTEIKGGNGGVRETRAAAREARCEVTP